MNINISDPYNLMTTLLLALILQFLFFIFAAIMKTDKLTDFSYGVSFIILVIYLLLKHPNPSLSQILIAICVIIWGIRLVSYLFIRILKIKKDTRFDGVRENFKKFLQFWILQGLSIWIIMIPTSIFISLSVESENYYLNINNLLGILLFTIGIIIESVADYQKYVFKNELKNKGKWIKTGLWKYSRHPNYFGEIIIWWGVFIYTINLLSGLTYLGVIGPLYITFLLIFVSGIPPLEKRYNNIYKDNLEYQRYKKTTSILIPLPQKSIT
ncbi:hypothetical protein A2X44_04760 [candidate division CPR3 bacterium GWF2_35_18]|uniref:Uncharacterized protein n=1 Tax=candidate division CPR3 bacterium GW2011_GWF2_35_18 TaxID=1618350 RepID=A0A0G0E3A6_UNCC3|nr:MAG: hypothetical protein UR67_C0003G0033 [candidate division CPR3 bacterium GW2011_GWF2_35_18]KKP86692.1 MAG: hypothetical protein UR87_C0013G0009 [candidate division CPR3 bacterium GW2011_GWE2_35_7]OGB63645.1 MAG: hypothetical protein A2X44_04760 [candidate division CPR3 bacterium GWF2_35_18]OGB65035.1 MAG: hypothetical protein A2250_01280 [candidate division CPR3 bacterium RIFOXYA2_FULL_35_13]OGB77211.1 MAG: hypothetical protein A2476_05425 [candidate division CPR3 bacterium RIFOXYC2_FULL